MYAITWIKSFSRNVIIYYVLVNCEPHKPVTIDQFFIQYTKVKYLKYELYFRHPLLLLLDINRSTIQFQWWHSGLYSQYSSLGQPSRYFLLLHNQSTQVSQDRTTTQKTEWSNPIITWDIRLRLPSLIKIVSSAHTIWLLSYTLIFSFVVVLSFRRYGHISYSSSHQITL